jgi:hypothetical protein
MEEIVDAIRFLYERAVEVLPWDGREGGYMGPHQDTPDVVFDLVDDNVIDATIVEQVCQGICDSLGYDETWTEFGSDASSDSLEYSWTSFSETVKHRHRFIFGNLSQGGDVEFGVLPFLESLSHYARDEFGLVTEVPRGTKLYRGRLTDDPRTIGRTAKDLGPAPKDQAVAGRFSPAGVPVFYAAADAQTAIAEIAGHDYRPFAVVGEFEVVRPLRVLDLTRRPELPSVFNRETRVEYRMVRFLGDFADHVSEPVVPNGRQDVEYVPTQVVAEYFRHAGDSPIDGLVVSSVHTGRPTHAYFLDADQFVTLDGGLSNSTIPRPDLVLEFGSVCPECAFQLDPRGVKVYEIRREYSGREV